MRKLLICGTAMAIALGAASARAQGRFTLDLRLTGVTPTEKLAGTDLSIGLGFGATVAFRLQPHLHVYGGWDMIKFAADESFAGADHDFDETGYTFGLRFEHPFGGSTGLLYRLEGGGTYKHIEIENAEGDIIADSDHSMGFEAGAGAVFNVNSKWRFASMLRFRSMSPEFSVGSATSSGALRYIGLELGVSRRF